MEALGALQDIYFIADSFGNYYRINDKDELVVAADKRDAGTFSYQEVQERIGKDKRAKYYTII